MYITNSSLKHDCNSQEIKSLVPVLFFANLQKKKKTNNDNKEKKTKQYSKYYNNKRGVFLYLLQTMNLVLHL